MKKWIIVSAIVLVIILMYFGFTKSLSIKYEGDSISAVKARIGFSSKTFKLSGDGQKGQTFKFNDKYNVVYEVRILKPFASVTIRIVDNKGNNYNILREEFVVDTMI